MVLVDQKLIVKQVSICSECPSAEEIDILLNEHSLF